MRQRRQRGLQLHQRGSLRDRGLLNNYQVRGLSPRLDLPHSRDFGLLQRALRLERDLRDHRRERRRVQGQDGGVRSGGQLLSTARGRTDALRDADGDDLLRLHQPPAV